MAIQSALQKLMGIDRHLTSMFDDVSNVFGRFDNIFSRGDDWFPLGEVYESPTKYEIVIDLPGIKKEEVTIQVKGNKLTVSGERTKPTSPEGSNEIHSEKLYGKYSRTYTFGEDLGNVEAVMENGVLKITAQKTVESAAKKIEIQ